MSNLPASRANALPYWVVLCWGRMFAGPDQSGAPWLFIQQSHAEHYANQLRAAGLDVEVRGFEPSTTEHNGRSLIQVPDIPPPSFEHFRAGSIDEHEPATASSEPETKANGTTVAPPPSLE